MNDLFDFANEEDPDQVPETKAPVLEPQSERLHKRGTPRTVRAGSIPDSTLDPDDDSSDLSDLPDWEEVPQARFLSWSPEMQFAYCARRDQDSALRSESVEEFDWFTERAALYKELIK